jgi:hypothetical protein
MLFLTVFCSSIAEYQLEHKIETTVKEAMVADLKSDLNLMNKSFLPQSVHVYNGYKSVVIAINRELETHNNESDLLKFNHEYCIGIDLLN